MTQLSFDSVELLSDHQYERRLVSVGYELHGGFDHDDQYQSPRTLVRWPAVKAWQGQLKQREWPLIDATTELLKRSNYPNLQQQQFLLKNGHGQSLWNSLTITGFIEARGRALCNLDAPDFQDVIVEDISNMCAGHLSKGLLWAHGADEGGDPNNPQIGAHDAMWFAARDLCFGKDAYPIPVIPETLSRPVDVPPFQGLSRPHADLISLLMNVLMIEVRAESFFQFCCKVMRASDTFAENKENALKAAQLVEFIRQDEAIHVAYLQTVISEMRGLTFELTDGSAIGGAGMIDDVWSDMVVWHGATQADLARDQSRTTIRENMLKTQNGGSLFYEFDALEGR